MLLGVLFWSLDPESVDDWRLSDRAKQVRDAWIERMEEGTIISPSDFVTVKAGPPSPNDFAHDVGMSGWLSDRLGLRDETVKRIQKGLHAAGPWRPQMLRPHRAEATIQLLESLDDVAETAAVVWMDGVGLLASFRFEEDAAVVVDCYIAVFCA